MYILIGVIVGAILIGLFILNIRGKVSKMKPSEFVEIKSFNENDYINENFNILFDSIKVDNWEKRIDYCHIEFSKGGVRDDVTLKVEYLIKGGIFTITGISMRAGINFLYNSEISKENYKFFYNCYTEYRNNLNDEAKKDADKALLRIHSVVGKSSIRNSRIDDILKK